MSYKKGVVQMAISTASVKGSGLTVPTFTGGTTEALMPLSQNLNERHVFIDGPDFLDRWKLTFKVKDPKPSTSNPSGYTQQRSEVLVRVPKTLANGELTYDTFSITCSTSVETTTSDKDYMRGVVSQIVLIADFDDFWNNGSLE
jgi:hypothetical protein